MIGSKLQW